MPAKQEVVRRYVLWVIRWRRRRLRGHLLDTTARQATKHNASKQEREKGHETRGSVYNGVGYVTLSFFIYI